MTVSWLERGEGGGGRGESLNSAPLSSPHRRYYITPSWLEEEGREADKIISPRGVGGGRLSTKETPQRRLREKRAKRKRVRNDKFLAISEFGSPWPVVSAKFGVSAAFPKGSACFRSTKMMFRQGKRGAHTAAQGNAHFGQLRSPCLCRSLQKGQTTQEIRKDLPGLN